jgi:hypothetical protein
MRTRACLATLLFAAAGLAIAAPPATAQEKDAVIEMARRRFQEGVKYFDQKRYEEARAAFLQAYALKHHPAVLLNLAQSEIRSGHPLEAARHFSAFLHESPNASSAERTEAEKGLAAARTKLGRIHIGAATGADVTVDGESVGQAPFAEPIDVLPGTHTIEGKLGTRTASTMVSVLVGKSASVSLNLEPAPTAATPPPPPPAPTGTVAPITPPPEVSEKPPEPPKESPPPSEPAQPVNEGREPFFIWLGHNGVGMAGLAATLIGTGVGTGFVIAGNKASENADSVASQIQNEAATLQVSSKSICVDPHGKVYNESILSSSHSSNVTDAQRNEEVARLQNACSMLSHNLDLRKTDRTLATAGFVLAGVGLTATLAAYFLTSGRSSSPSGQGASTVRALVLPVIGGDQAGLAVIGSF